MKTPIQPRDRVVAHDIWFGWDSRRLDRAAQLAADHRRAGYDEGDKAGYERAIAEVVAWLRSQAGFAREMFPFTPEQHERWTEIADAIEAGEHRKGAT